MNYELEKILNQDYFTRDEIIFLLNLDKEEDIKKLFAKADEVRRIYCGDEVHLRGVIEFSNYCDEHCMYCGLREDNFSISRYRMTAEEIIETAKVISNSGIKTIVLQSGEDGYYDTDMIAYIIYSIKQTVDAAVTLSLGDRGFEEYRNWKIAGADRYLLKHETANPKLFSVYHNGEQLEERIGHLRYLRSLGYQVGTGNLIGLPNQTIADIADDILLMNELDVHMAAFAPFIPSPFTPYQNIKHGSVELTLKTMAVTRIVMKEVHIPATTALDSIDKLGREKGLNCGANVVMPNFTPHPYRENYVIYSNKRGINDDPEIVHKNIIKRIESIGRRISISRGDSPKLNKTV